MSGESESIAKLHRSATENMRLHRELLDLKNHLHLLEDAVRLAAAGDTTPSERIMAASALGARLLTSRSVLGSSTLESGVGEHWMNFMRPFVSLLRRVVLTCADPAAVMVKRIELGGCLLIAQDVPGDQLTAWGPLSPEIIWEARSPLKIVMVTQVAQSISITLFGEEQSETPPPWISP